MAIEINIQNQLQRMSEKYEQLVEENLQLKKALVSSKNVIERNQNDYDTLKAIHQETKMHYDQTKRENAELRNRIQILAADKKEQEEQFDGTIRNLKISIEQKQREIEEVQQKMMPQFDQDMLRIRIINDLEIPHRQQMEAKQNEIDRLQEQIYQLKRQIDLSQAKAENLGLEYQKELKIMREKYSIEVEDYKQQLEELSKQVDDTNDKLLIKKLRKDVDEYRQKITNKDQECDELRDERDRLRDEKNELMMKYARQIDQERNEKRAFKSETEKLSVRVRYLEDEWKKDKIRKEQIQTELELLKTEKETFYTEVRKKDDTIHYLQRKITQMEEDHLQLNQKSQDQLSRMYSEEHDKYLQERNKALTIVKDLDHLKKKFQDLNDDYRELKDKYLKDIGNMKDEQRLIADENDKIKRNMTILQREHADLQRQYKIKEEQVEDYEVQNENIKKRNRDLIHQVQMAETQNHNFFLNPNKYHHEQQPQQPQQPQPQQAPQPIAQQDQDYKTHPKNADRGYEQEIRDLQEENEKLNQLIKRLKGKLKEANNKIMELLTRKLKEKQSQKSNAEQVSSKTPPGMNYENDDPQQPSINGFQYGLSTGKEGGVHHQVPMDIDDEQLLYHVKLLTNADEVKKQQQVWYQRR